MFVFFPVFAFCLACIFFTRCRLERSEAVLAAAVLCGLIVAFLTEILSALQSLHAGGLVVGWGLSAAALYAAIVAFPKPAPTPVTPWRSLPLFARLLLLGAAVIVVICGMQAILIAPNSWDGTTYHLSRIEHWVQNHTVAYYPTHIVRQLTYMPFAEWCLVQLRILTGPDYPANLLQFVGLLITLTGIWLIAKQLGAGVAGRSLAVLLTACLPMGILQSTSTQTDYAVTQWFVIFVYFLLKSMRGDSFAFILASCALGLAWLTKGYAYLYSLPFLVWWMLSAKPRWKERVVMLLGLFAIAVIINAGYFCRNAHAFGQIFWSREHLTNETVTLPIFLVNLLRNCALHLISPSGRWNHWVTERLHGLAERLHMDLNPIAATFGAPKFELQPLAFEEDYAGNLLHSLLFAGVAVTAALKWMRGKRQAGMAAPYAGAVAAMFLLLCLALRFQPFGSRFHLAVFVLLCAWAALVIEKTWPQKLVMAVAGLVWAASLPWLVLNENKPLVGREPITGMSRMQQAFITDPLWLEHMSGIARYIQNSGCRNIGFYGVEDSKEYFVWQGLHAAGMNNNFRLEHVHVSNPTVQLPYPLGPFKPCALVSLYFKNPRVLDSVEGMYIRAWSLDNGGASAPHHSAVFVPLESWDGPSQNKF